MHSTTDEVTIVFQQNPKTFNSASSCTATQKMFFAIGTKMWIQIDIYISKVIPKKEKPSWQQWFLHIFSKNTDVLYT